MRRGGAVTGKAVEPPHPELTKLEVGQTVFSSATLDKEVAEVVTELGGSAQISATKPGTTAVFHFATKITRRAYLNEFGQWQVDGITGITARAVDAVDESK